MCEREGERERDNAERFFLRLERLWLERVNLERIRGDGVGLSLISSRSTHMYMCVAI